MSRVRDHRALDVGVREAEPALPQVLGVRAARSRPAAPVRRGQDSRLKPSILELAAPHADERVLQQVADALGVGGIGLQAEVVDPRGLAIGRRDLVGALVGHLAPRCSRVGSTSDSSTSSELNSLRRTIPSGASSGR